ncbi:winged helix-turn-helix domain-containing protein [uncultured Roseobacter sp.]|uniref:winged helix-turn-helix domain-containing tetratricopeptide repeat protein n=1 Tax=uncultured Roseobacter sp. TaxID=114847 RepID=UPI00262F640C|nr:winged helix-turn-helix domain-containing protein [uncultured Roseobacter sp.]
MKKWAFTPSENRLETGNEIATVTGKASSVLKYLLENEGRVVSRDEILKAIWRDVHVTPDIVREYIFDLRQALGDSASNPRYIETVRGKGFRLLGGVEVQRRKPDLPNAMRRARIAVLRPLCLEGGERWQRFADGMADELITDLARFSDLAVVARVSSFGADTSKSILDVVEQLDCDYVLESSLSAWPDGLKAQFQLIDGRDGLHAWADTIERPIGSMPQLSGEIALSVANQLGGMSGAIIRSEQRYAVRRPMSALTAYENYVMACQLEERYDQASMRKGLAHAERAIEIDPEFARGHLVRAFFCERGEAVSSERTRDEWIAETQASAERAMTIDTRDPLILSICARSFASTGRVAEARNAVIRAADFAQNESQAALETASALTLVAGEYDLADHLLETAFALCPMPPAYYAFAKGRNLLFSGRYQEAEAVAETGPDYESTYVIGCLAQSLQNKAAEARRTHEILMSKYPHFSFARYPETFGIVAETTLDTYRDAVARLALD